MQPSNAKARLEAKRLYFRLLKKSTGMTLDKIASSMGLEKPTALYNCLRPGRNVPEFILEKLRELAPSLDQSGLTIEPETIVTFAHAASLVRTFDSPFVKRGVFEEEVKILFKSLGANEYSILFSMDQCPLELDPHQGSVARAMRESIGRGATFLYCVPSPGSAAAVHIQHHQLSDRLLRLGGGCNDLMDEQVHQLGEGVRERLRTVTLDDCRYFVPGFKFALFISGNLPQNCMATMSFPDGGSIASPTYAHVRLSDLAARHMALSLLDRTSGYLRGWASANEANNALCQAMRQVIDQ